MGAAAFIMAEMISVPYSNIITWAAIPALLYYLSIISRYTCGPAKTDSRACPKTNSPRQEMLWRSAVIC